MFISALDCGFLCFLKRISSRLSASGKGDWIVRRRVLACVKSSVLALTVGILLLVHRGL
jgi:hypothetical protein